MWGEYGNTKAESQPSKYLLSKEEMDEICSVNDESEKLGFSAVKKDKEFSHHLPVSHFSLDPLTLHNMDLLNCIKNCKKILNALQSSRHEEEDLTIPNLPSVPFPQPKHPLVAISSEGARQLLDRAVFYTCAHAGFNGATSSAMEILVDLVKDYLTRFTTTLKQHLERETLGLSTGFPDVFERTCFDVGLGSVRNLFTYHKSLIAYNRVLQKDCDNLRTESLSALRQYQSELHFNSLHNETWNEDGEWSCSDEPSKSTSERKTSGTSLRYFLGDSEVEIDTEDDLLTGNQLHLENAPPGALETEMQMLNTLEEQEALNNRL